MDKERITHYQDAVDDLFSKLHDTAKSALKQTPEEDLIYFFFTLGQRIRILYDMWNNEPLVKSTGCSHPDEASYEIILGVWTKLQQNPNIPILKSAPKQAPSFRAAQHKALQKYKKAMGDVLNLG